MRYLHFTTRSLIDLVPNYKGGSFPWEQLGTSARAINLDKIDGGNATETPEDGTAYLLPIVNESACNSFIDNIKQYGISAEILTEEEALKQWGEYKTIKLSRE